MARAGPRWCTAATPRMPYRGAALTVPRLAGRVPAMDGGIRSEGPGTTRPRGGPCRGATRVRERVRQALHRQHRGRPSLRPGPPRLRGDAPHAGHRRPGGRRAHIPRVRSRLGHRGGHAAGLRRRHRAGQPRQGARALGPTTSIGPSDSAPQPGRRWSSPARQRRSRPQPGCAIPAEISWRGWPERSAATQPSAGADAGSGRGVGARRPSRGIQQAATASSGRAGPGSQARSGRARPQGRPRAARRAAGSSSRTR